ncbi:leucyl/phenylalanyl-tRNA--protein transferase [Sphingosinicella rhizophila]|uniref:Leucyl/phenylalanyl-tRNA--protein transferase n=1 Tax=Sphingosinicella rhizophila TaxID=3050082 RepID=A0ABU3Q4N1_9SPHN|nr:leucyl/phenylalanyl-tRNA--protein transferase [Sphingosinicella sp. GR2756]MDT9598372.1 leucyl/phenylalanyl-tRNA--protein transferase [Sphingosinicella sp. GR2756]
MAVIDPDLLLRAYSIGVFPMADSRDAGEIFWVEPRRRAIIPLDGLRLSRSLRKSIRSGAFRVTRDAAFPQVVRHCAERTETWINRDIEDSYIRLHRMNHAHSIECWHDETLVGGLYGVTLGAAFFGESMFSIMPDASKVALAWLVARLKVGGYRLLDCQFMTEHLRSLGAIEIDQKSYVTLLSAALSAGAAEGDGASGDGVAASGGAASPPPAVEFGALDRLLEADPARTVDGPASGCVILQLLGQTS